MKLARCIAGLCLLAAGCSHGDDNPRTAPDKPANYMLYSPNGEPLNGGPLGKPTCLAAMSGWFDRMRGSDNTISKAVFLGDAQAQFAKMDIDQRGYLVSEELDRYRAPYRQQVPDEHVAAPEKPAKGHGKHKDKSAGVSHSDPSLSMSDPVMSADRNLDFKVSPEEFLNQAQEVFARLDVNQDGRLDKAETVKLCESYAK